MKKKYLAYTIVPAMALALTGIGIASAHGWFGGFGPTATPEEIASRQITMFQSQAEMLGANVDEVKNAWASGKSLRDLAQEKGITDEQLQAKMKEQRQAQMKSHLQTLVTQGVITQAQADQRLQFMSTQAANGKGMFGRRGGHHGMGGMMGYGF